MQRVVATQPLRALLRPSSRFRVETRAWRRPSGQAIVEFAMASTLFFLLLFGTIDFGRSIYMYAELRNAVREGARYASINPSSTTEIQNYVIEKAPGLGLTASEVSVSCTPTGTPSATASCVTGNSIRIVASLGFQAITQRFLGIGAVTMKAAATDTIE